MHSKFALASYLIGLFQLQLIGLWFGGKCAHISLFTSFLLSTATNNVPLSIAIFICKMSSTTFQEALIIAVSKRPCLWRKSDKNYHDSRTVKENNWRDVMAEVLEAAVITNNEGLTGREQK